MKEPNSELSKSEIGDLVSRSASDIFFIDISEISPDSRFDQDLLADKVKLLDFVELVETKLLSLSLSISIPNDIFVEVDTVGELTDSIWNEVIAIVGVE